MIEIGKKYEVINSWAGNDGLIVTVIGYGGSGTLDNVNDHFGDHWYIDQRVVTTSCNYVNHFCEKQLKPIYDGNEKTEWSELVNIFIPSQLKEKNDNLHGDLK